MGTGDGTGPHILAIVDKPFDLDELLKEVSRCLHQHDLEPASS